ncbi:conserved hypothetical protein [Streptomyces sviceus ATCC 29083]|uniref:Uncharacterized protein n=1 Tax=Streptomyces sviceus (strain ATCC 29083 / DSM 924 / JCM 4929 / NBRC 13980 / NCIMB 11184 / NRRL 5439 / UC 5370) TaxID=463191 RepID=B5I3F3_STRX2|nr:conserved hypothetical protein [Streptomyces sviceus ATCC 29083]
MACPNPPENAGRVFGEVSGGGTFYADFASKGGLVAQVAPGRAGLVQIVRSSPPRQRDDIEDRPSGTP